MVTLLVIQVIIFTLVGIGLVFTGVNMLLRKEIILTSRNTKYLTLHPLFRVFIPGAYDTATFHLRGWKKMLFGLLLLILGVCSFFVTLQLILLASVLSQASQLH